VVTDEHVPCAQRDEQDKHDEHGTTQTAAALRSPWRRTPVPVVDHRPALLVRIATKAGWGAPTGASEREIFLSGI
jgi:hypothetical protein